MIHHTHVSRLSTALLSALLLAACQAAPVQQFNKVPPKAPALRVTSQVGLQQQIGTSIPKVSLKQELIKVSEVKVIPQSQNRAQIRVTLSVNLPDASRADGFQTQALDMGQITKIWSGIRGVGIDINTPIFANEADAQGYVSQSGTGDFTLTFSNVPYGVARTLFVSFQNDSNELIAPGAYVWAGFNLNSATKNVDLSFRTRPLGEVLGVMRERHLSVPSDGTETENAYVLSQVDLAALQTFIDTITGVSGTAPNYTYTVHPSLIDIETLAADLIAVDGDVSQLSSTPLAYVRQAASVAFEIGGLIGADKATIVVRDPASQPLSNLGNGVQTITGVSGHIDPADRWQFEVHAPGYTSYIQEIALQDGQALDLGLISLSVASAPVIDSISTSSGIIGSQITITGSNFHSTPAGNTVYLGATEASIVSGNETELVVTVPTAPSGNLTVQVGTETSNTFAFNVLPTVQLTAPTSGAVLNGVVTLSSGFTTGSTVTKVEYFSGVTKLGESTIAPYSFSWDTAAGASGNHSLTSKITDSEGNTATSTAVDVTVNQLPVITALTASISPIIGLSHPTKLTCNATDAESTATISWETVGGSFGTFDSTTGESVYWTSPATAGGPYTVRCTANDGSQTVTQDLSLTVLSGTGNVTGNGGLY